MALAPDYPLFTARLILRPYERGDLDAFHAMRNDPEHTRFVPYDPAPRDEVAELLDKRMTWTALDGDHGAITLAVLEKDTGVYVGDQLLFRYDADTRAAELGYAFDNAHHRKGYATEASRAIVDWGFREGGLRRIYAVCSPENGASIRVLEKLGFREESRGADSVVFAQLAADRRP